jgi:hypothetical protein
MDGVSEKDTAERPTRWQRREQRRVSEHLRMKKHGAGMSRIYANAIQKRLTQAAKKNGHGTKGSSTGPSSKRIDP